MIKNDDEDTVSTVVEKLNVTKSKVSPKKKKNIQNEIKKYEVVLEVIVVKWNL